MILFDRAVGHAGSPLSHGENNTIRNTILTKLNIAEILFSKSWSGGVLKSKFCSILGARWSFERLNLSNAIEAWPYFYFR